MDEQRIREYLNLIQELLTCPNGEEPEILSRSSELVDQGFVLVCVAMASKLEEEGQENHATFLRNLAEQLTEYLNMTENSGEEEESQSDYSVEDYKQFLKKLIQTIVDSDNNRQVVYSLLLQNQDELDLNFAQIITQWFNSAIDPKNSKRNHALASLLNIIGINIKEFPLGQQINNIEIAITCYQAALTVRTFDAFPKEWADTQNNLGEAYRSRIRGSRTDNLEFAIACYQATLTIVTHDTFPEDWARTQHNLGAAYYERIKGSRADNLEFAITCYQSALTVLTHDAFPEDWVMTQYTLGIAYSERIKGSRADNLEFAITCYQSALTIYNPDTFPQNWAATQNNLGLAYSERIKGSRADNLELAITCYQSALTVYTPDIFPQKWAMTQNNLTNVYSKKINR